jgi:hypothetical protein
VFVDAGDLSPRPVLDPRLTGCAVLLGECDQVALPQAVMLVGQPKLVGSEFAALCAQVLSTSVEPVDLVVRGVGDQSAQVVAWSSC